LLRGWLPFYRISVGLGVRALARGNFSREAFIRVVAPIEDTRLFELPATVDALDARPGERVLDLASPKLAAVALARAGVEVTSVDAYEAEVETWRRLTPHVPRLDLQVGDGRKLPFADETFDHAYSISVIEHIGEDGDYDALAELARVVKPGGRIVVTVPFSETYSEDWRDAPLYGEEGTAQRDGRWFFSRIYDDERLQNLITRTPLVRELWRRPVRFHYTRLYRFYNERLPATLVLSPVLGLMLDLEEEPGGLMMLTLTREAGSALSG
jgi:SAM-dependent methyltransferase